MIYFNVHKNIYQITNILLKEKCIPTFIPLEEFEDYYPSHDPRLAHLKYEMNKKYTSVKEYI